MPAVIKGALMSSVIVAGFDAGGHRSGQAFLMLVVIDQASGFDARGHRCRRAALMPAIIIGGAALMMAVVKTVVIDTAGCP
jgi:hypothetical protein